MNELTIAMRMEEKFITEASIISCCIFATYKILMTIVVDDVLVHICGGGGDW